MEKRPGRGCWEYRGGKTKGYGRFWVSDERPRESAHRYAWELANGPIPKGKLVLHKCDNPPCVRPDHLELGTHQDNQRQKWERGRGASKLKEADVQEVLRLTALGIDRWDLAKRYRVRPSTIARTVSGSRWSRVKGPRPLPMRQGLSPAEESRVREQLSLGVPKAKLARDYRVGPKRFAELEAKGLPEKPPVPEKGTQEEVDELRRRHGLGVMAQTLARDFQTTLGRIHRRLKHGLAEQSGEPKLTAAKVEEMRHLRALGARMDDLAGKYEVSRSAVQQACDGKTWRSAPGPLAGVG